MDPIWQGLLDALGAAGSMTWQVTWSLILGSLCLPSCRRS
jgi:hypothetical protein